MGASAGEGRSPWGRWMEIHPEPCSGALPPKQHSLQRCHRIPALPWDSAGGPSTSQDELFYFHAVYEQG